MDTQETKIRKGQAFNLSVADAIHSGNENNPKYIYKKFIYYYSLADVVQGSDIDMIQEVVDSSSFDKAMEMLKKAMEK